MVVSENGRLRVVGIGGTLREGSSSPRVLRRALVAEVELPDLRELAEYGGGADALIPSTAAYHGTLAGVTKNALDYAQFLSRDERPYFDGKVVGLIATAGGASTTGALVNVVHALRGTVAPLMVAVPQAWKRAHGDGEITDETYGGRLESLGRLVEDLASRLAPAAEPVLRASA